MVTPTIKLITGQSKSNLAKNLDDLSKAQVYVGVPESTASRSGEPINNAELTYLMTHGVRESSMRRIVQAKMNRGMTFSAATAAFLHSYGSPRMNIPPRPIIEPAIEASDNKDAIMAELKLAAKAALQENASWPEVKRHLDLAGMTAQNAVRGWFTDSRNNWAPNAPSTIARKGSSRPLIDTGALRQAMTYVVVTGKE